MFYNGPGIKFNFITSLTHAEKARDVLYKDKTGDRMWENADDLLQFQICIYALFSGRDDVKKDAIRIGDFQQTQKHV